MKNQVAVIFAGLCLLLPMMACEKKEAKKGKSEDLTIVVEADRSKITKEEQELRARQAAFDMERKRLREERAKLMKEKERLGSKGSLAHIKELEQRLWQKERQMWNKEAELEKVRNSIAQNKDKLLAKVSGAKQVGGDLAKREQDLARREAQLAKREQQLSGIPSGAIASRMDKLEQRMAELTRAVEKLASVRSVPMPRMHSPSGRVSRKQSKKTFAKATTLMRKKGLLWGDLPGDLKGFRDDYYASQKSADYAKANDLAEMLMSSVKNLAIDSEFISGKFTRLNELIARKPIKAKDKKRVSSLLRKATQLVGDGQFFKANRELNRIFALLK